MGRLAFRLARAEALPYWSIVVETCACRMSFCCTPTGAPVSSSQAILYQSRPNVFEIGVAPFGSDVLANHTSVGG
jgi:hypothetical protein